MLPAVGEKAGYHTTAAEHATRMLNSLCAQTGQPFEFRKQRRTILRFLSALVAIAIIFAFTIRALSTKPGLDAGRYFADNKNSYPTSSHVKEKSFLHFLLPATSPNLDVCKTLISAAVLNYSTPTLINWGKHFTDPRLAAGGSHLGKISGVLNYLNDLGSENDEDLVVVADAYDVWFQLGPQFLISRYYEANRLANERISRRLCGHTSCTDESMSHISQHIIFSTQKRCWPHHADELACYASPPSTLPEDIYGPDTDHIYPYDHENIYLNMRPRYMNSGFIIGNVGALRNLFTEAQRQMKLNPQQGSDQGVFSGILGAQEYARELVRQRYLAHRPFHRFTNMLSSLFGKSSYDKNRDALLKHSPSKEVLPVTATTHLSSFEFYIGLDYDNTFSIPTVFQPRDADWVTFNKPDDPSAYWHIVSPAIKTSSLPTELKTSPSPPFNHLALPAFDNVSATLTSLDRERHGRTLSGIRAPLPSVPHPHSSYADIPLYTNLFLSTVPITVHHNAHQSGMKRHRETMWGQPWWSAYARQMLSAHIKSPREPIATLLDTANGELREFWSPVEKKGGARLDNGTFVDLNFLCGHAHSNGAKWESDLFWVGDEWDKILGNQR